MKIHPNGIQAGRMIKLKTHDLFHFRLFVIYLNMIFEKNRTLRFWLYKDWRVRILWIF
jgi:hypothetical protein